MSIIKANSNNNKFCHHLIMHTIHKINLNLVEKHTSRGLINTMLSSALKPWS